MPKQTCECGATYRFAESSFGKRAKCNKCGAIITLEGDDVGVIPIAVEDDQHVTPADSDQEFRQSIGAGRSATPVEDEATNQPRTYFADFFTVLAFPKDPSNLVTFLFVWGMLCVNMLFRSAFFPFGIVVQVIILGWYCAFRFNLIRESTGGELGLPKLTLADGPVEEIIIPLARWLGCWLIVLLPSVIGLKALIGTGTSGVTVLNTIFSSGIGGLLQAGIITEALLFFSLLGMGLFMWPIVILCVAVDGFGSLARVDLLFITVVKTFGVYILTVLLVFGADFVESYLAGQSEGLLWRATILGVGLYLEIVALQMVGLYYHHFKDRFAWSWG